MIQHFRATVIIAVSLLAGGRLGGTAEEGRDLTSAPLSPVTVAEDSNTFTLSNSAIVAKVAKRSGDLISLRYKSLELLGSASGHPFAYWSHDASSGRHSVAVTTDPNSNGGERAEVAVQSISEGRALGNGPGGGVIADIEIRYSLGRRDRGIYTYCVFAHKAEYPSTSVGEARFCAKLNRQVFDWMTIDARCNKQMPTPDDWDKGTPLNMKEARRLNSGIYAGEVEHKYDYSAIQFDIPAFGWSSTKQHVGFWFINPSIEYLSGGATKVELTGHLDNNAGAAPTLLNYWRGSHYGGSSCVLAQGEAWTKVIGPFLIYCNTGREAQEMWKDALAQASREAEAWPYEWARGIDYPNKQQRGCVLGEILLRDRQIPTTSMSNLLVGISHPDYVVPGDRRRFGGDASVDWQMDAKYYQFWVRGNSDGEFVIPKVRPGNYTLHAIADGVLGEFILSNVGVAAAQTTSLGRLEWKPVRHGRQLWEIGIPNRSAEEFRHGDHYWQWGLYAEYPKEFPNDVNFVIGKSDWRKDWNYCQCPRLDRAGGTTWSVFFDLPTGVRGSAMLRLALAATSARSIQVAVNERPVGVITGLRDTASIRRDGIRGYWSERDLAFDADMLKAGTNVLKLTIPPGNPMNGIEYDYLRLELGSHSGTE